MNLDKLIDQWIGEEKHTPYKENHTLGDEVVWTFEDGYNQALQDLKSRKQELIESVKKILVEKVTKNYVKNLTAYPDVAVANIITLLKEPK